MEKYIDVMKQSTDLLETSLEGLIHTQVQMNEGKFESAVQLFSDVVYAFSTIDKSLNSLPAEIASKEIVVSTDKIRNSIEMAVSAFEVKKYGKVQEILQFTLIPGFKKWKLEVEDLFNPYIIS